MQKCLHPELWKQVLDSLKELKNYTGLNPLANGNSLRGRIDAVGSQIAYSINRQNLFFSIIAAVLATVVLISVYITKTDSKEVQNMARQISTLADAARSIKP